MGEVFQELKRRNIFRVTVAYVMLSWVLLQAVGLIAPGLGLPDWTFPLAFLFLIIGFPLSLIFAWAFELTPEGLKRASDVHPEQSMAPSTGRKLDFVIIGFLSMAVLLLLVNQLFLPPAAQVVAPPEEPAVVTAGSWSSIAVMPFVNMSSDPEQEYFSDGISEELLNVLQKAKGLRVAARTSSFSFKGKDTAIPEIGNLLNVETVLEGSVRKSGTKLRITAQLIDVANGYHIWSETYDRETRDIFAIQDEIAGAITTAMSAHLPGLDNTSEPKHQPTLEAHNLYLAGRHQIEQRTAESTGKSLQLFDQAIAADPLFAAAYASKAQAIILSRPALGFLNSEEEALTLSLLETALQLDPNHADAHAVRGLLLMNLDDNDAAIIELERAISLNFNLAEAHMWLGMSYVRSNRKSDGLSEYLLAYEIDPLDLRVIEKLAFRLWALGRYEESQAVIERKRFIDTSYSQKVVTLDWDIDIPFVQGKIAEAYRQFQELGDLVPEGYGAYAGMSAPIYLSLMEPSEELHPMSDETLFLLNALLGDHHAARIVHNKLSEQDRKESSDTYALRLGRLSVLEGDFEAAVKAFEQVSYERVLGINYSSPVTLYAWALIATGRQSDADRLLDDIVRQIEQSKGEGEVWTRYARTESEVHVLRGEFEKAIDVLEEAYDQGMRFRVWRDNPLLAPIKGHPRFVALFEKTDEDFRLARIEVGLDQPSKTEPD